MSQKWWADDPTLELKIMWHLLFHSILVDAEYTTTNEMENHGFNQHIVEYRNITDYHRIIKYKFLKDVWVHHVNEYIS